VAAKPSNHPYWKAARKAAGIDLSPRQPPSRPPGRYSIPLPYAVAAHRASRWQGSLGFLGAIDEFDDILSKLGGAYRAAKQVYDDPPFGTGFAVRQSWLTSLKLVNEQILPLLNRTIAGARLNTNDRRKWLLTAQSALEQLQLIPRDARQQGIYNTAAEAIGVALKTVVQAVVDTAEDVAKGAAKNILGPIVSSPLFWIALLGLGAWKFRGKLGRSG